MPHAEEPTLTRPCAQGAGLRVANTGTVSVTDSACWPEAAQGLQPRGQQAGTGQVVPGHLQGLPLQVRPEEQAQWPHREKGRAENADAQGQGQGRT